MEYSEDIFLENVKNTFLNLWLWIPLAVIIFVILIRNNSWKKNLLNLFFLFFLFVISIWVDKRWGGGGREAFLSAFFTIGCFLLYLIRSKKLIISVLFSFLGLYIVFPDVDGMILWRFIRGFLISSMAYLLDLGIVVQLFKEQKKYISVEYTKSGYQTRDVNLLILFLYLTLFMVVFISLYNLIKL